MQFCKHPKNLFHDSNESVSIVVQKPSGGGIHLKYFRWEKAFLEDMNGNLNSDGIEQKSKKLKRRNLHHDSQLFPRLFVWSHVQPHEHVETMIQIQFIPHRRKPSLYIRILSSLMDNQQPQKHILRIFCLMMKLMRFDKTKQRHDLCL